MSKNFIENDYGVIFHCKDKEKVEIFIQDKDYILPFIKQSILYLVKYFGQPLEITLEVMSFPEDATEDELIAWIKSSDEIETGLDKLEGFNDEWFLDRMQEVDYCFNFNLE